MLCRFGFKICPSLAYLPPYYIFVKYKRVRDQDARKCIRMIGEFNQGLLYPFI